MSGSGSEPESLKRLLYRITARYAAVRPGGVDIDGRLQPRLQARVLSYGAARTFYRGRKPYCRSLDAVTALSGRTCADCPDRRGCTPQVRLDFLVDGRPYRLLLAYTSAKNFLLYVDSVRGGAIPIEDLVVRISVVDRGSWGELRFETS